MEDYARGHIKSTKNPKFHTFFEILGILLNIPSISKSRYEKPNVSEFLILNRSIQDFSFQEY